MNRHAKHCPEAHNRMVTIALGATLYEWLN